MHHLHVICHTGTSKSNSSRYSASFDVLKELNMQYVRKFYVHLKACATFKHFVKRVSHTWAELNGSLTLTDHFSPRCNFSD